MRKRSDSAKRTVGRAKQSANLVGIWRTAARAVHGLGQPIKCVFQQRRYGRVVNVVSLSGIKGMPGQTNYSAAKAGVIGATKALAQEVAKRGITVNAVAPGFIRTDMTKELNEKQFKDIIPMQRFGEPDEVAEAIVFLASSKASYITGSVISINGGLYT